LWDLKDQAKGCREALTVLSERREKWFHLELE
jgi:hypothetical protein